MSLRTRGLAFTAAATWLTFASCAPPPPPPPPPPPTFPEVVKFSGEIFASEWGVSVVVKDSTTLAQAKTLPPLIEATLKEVERQLSLWEPQSELARYNRTPWTKPLPQSPGLLQLTRTALAVGKDTDGAFDVTIGPLLDLWGFSPATKGKVKEPPGADAIAAAKAKTGLGLIHVVDGGLKKDREDLIVDLTAIGDGAAAGAVMTLLRERGFTDALVDVAGEVVVSGQGKAGPWRVGVNTPKASAAPTDTTAMTTLTPAPSSTLALSTSGTYREAFEAGGVRYAHILDPRTGAPVQHTVVSCTIVGPDVVVADALSTACVVLGDAGTRAVLPRFPGYSALFLSDLSEGEGGAVTETHTPDFPLAVTSPSPSTPSTPSTSPSSP